MMNYDFDYIKKVGENIIFNDRIITCSDTNTAVEGGAQHSHSFYEIQYVFNGEGVGITKSTNSFFLKSGFVSVFRPGIQHAYFSTKDMSLVNICFYPNDLQKDIISYMENYEFALDDNTKLEFEMLYYLLRQNLSESSSQNDQKADIYLSAILNILSTISQHNNAKINRWNYLLYQVSQNYATITLQEAAKICNCSESFFCRTFKKDFGQTFLQYLDKIRLEKAKSLLKTSNMNIDEISRMVGFSYNTRFYRIFQKHTGMTPNQYKSSINTQTI